VVTVYRIRSYSKPDFLGDIRFGQMGLSPRVVRI
jgi:hypothetical protein